MSSGKIEREIIRILDGNIMSQNIPTFDSKKFQLLKLNLHSNSKPIFSKFNNILENSFTQKYKDEFNDYLDIIKEIHIILLGSSNLTNKEKFYYCNSQRYFIKRYLKKLLEKKRN